jgi:hypothetical protein
VGKRAKIGSHLSCPIDYIRDGLIKPIKRITLTKRRCQKARPPRRSMVFSASGCAVSELPGRERRNRGHLLTGKLLPRNSCSYAPRAHATAVTLYPVQLTTTLYRETRSQYACGEPSTIKTRLSVENAVAMRHRGTYILIGQLLSGFSRVPTCPSRHVRLFEGLFLQILRWAHSGLKVPCVGLGASHPAGYSYPMEQLPQADKYSRAPSYVSIWSPCPLDPGRAPSP